MIAIKSTVVVALIGFVFVGLDVLLLIAPLMRGLYYYSDLLQVQFLLGAVCLIYGLVCLLKGEKTIRLSLLDLFILGYFTANLLSLSGAVHLKDAIFGVIKVLDYVIIYFLVSKLTADMRYRNNVVIVLFLSTVVASIAAHLITMDVIAFQIPSSYSSTRILSTLEYYNAYAILAATGVILGLGLLEKVRTVKGKAVIGGAIYLNTLGILASQSRATWILLTASLIAYLYFSEKKRFWSTFYFLFGLIFVSLLMSNVYQKAFGVEDHVNVLIWTSLSFLGFILFTALIYKMPQFAWRHRLGRRYSTIVPGILTVGLLIIGIVYFQYVSSVVPSAAGQLISEEILSRIETISGQDMSFQQRMNMNTVGWRIVGDYPICGSGAGGWDALYHLYQQRFYWSSEVHNHFLQVWVETGTIGFITYAGIWITLLIMVYRYMRKRRGKSSWNLTWAVFLSILLLLFHSAIDFDQSIPAMAIVLWSLAALLQNQIISDSKWKLKLRFPAFGVMLLMLAVTVFFYKFGYIEYKAQIFAHQASEAIAVYNYPSALEKYEEAYRLSPYSGKWAANLAQLHAYNFLTIQAEESKKKAYDYAQKAIRHTPYYIKGSQMIAQAYYLLGDKNARIQEQERLTMIAPKMVEAWEALAVSRYEQGIALLDKGEFLQARKMLIESENAAIEVDENYNAAKKFWSMRPTAELHLLAGQTALLLGEKEKALEKLSVALRSKNTKDKAGLWLTLAYMDEDEKNFRKYFKQYVESSSEKIAEFEINKNRIISND